jgi:hypothetical protein
MMYGDASESGALGDVERKVCLAKPLPPAHNHVGFVRLILKYVYTLRSNGPGPLEVSIKDEHSRGFVSTKLVIANYRLILAASNTFDLFSSSHLRFSTKWATLGNSRVDSIIMLH